MSLILVDDSFNKEQQKRQKFGVILQSFPKKTCIMIDMHCEIVHSSLLYCSEAMAHSLPPFPWLVLNNGMGSHCHVQYAGQNIDHKLITFSWSILIDMSMFIILNTILSIAVFMQFSVCIENDLNTKSSYIG